MEQRTYEDFVEDMLKRDRTDSQIVAVALSTRWKNQVPEIRKYLKKWHKLFGGKKQP